ncbi:MAG: DUF1097 domain-containing protein [Maledivibacter sp.]|jgi:hypothetical protein|nr:DUF1097 domain-containing protein [Maledivibacter sp.]
MGNLAALSLMTAILCGIWVELSSALGLLGWAGFAGCTAFFAAGGKIQGLKSSLPATLSGVFWAMVIIKMCNYMEFSHVAGISTALITFIMCIQAKIKLFEFIPGTFIGSFSTFASGGDWKGVVITLILGAILGYACESSGTWFYNVTNRNTNSQEKDTKEQEAV